MKLFTNIQETKICEEYVNGASSVKIAETLGVTPQIICYVLKKHEVSCRTQSEAHIRHNYDSCVFDTISENSAYWIGILLADGNVYEYPNKNHAPLISLTLKESDKEHIIKFRSFLKATHRLRYNKIEHSYSFRLSSQKLADSLSNYNILPRKSLTTKAPDSLLYNSHFWRGCIDGDGSLGIYKNSPRILLSGTEELLTQFIDFLKKEKILNNTPKFVKKRKIFEVGLYGNNAVKTVALLYNNCETALNRKLEIARKIIILGATKYNENN